jgi:hypothetical protein
VAKEKISELVNKYKWEFLRRNKSYIAAYNRLVSYRKSPKYNKDLEAAYTTLPFFFDVKQFVDPSKDYKDIVKGNKKVFEDIF